MRPCPLLRKLPNIRLIVGAKFGRGGLGVLAAYSVGYIFEVVMAALRYMGLSPHTPIRYHPKHPKESTAQPWAAGVGSAESAPGGWRAGSPIEMKTHNSTTGI